MVYAHKFGLFAACLMLCGCSVDLGLAPETPQTGAFVVGDEPYAVKAATAVLAQGGNAADAAAAMYFALAVTYPVAAGLGGGGICLVHDPKSGRNEEFDFLARSSASGGAFAVPGNVRGFAAMQTAFGVLPWQRIVAQAEGLASTGFPVSSALAARLASSEDVVRLDAGLASEFMDESGHLKPAGSIVASRELADTLTAIRTQGADAFYGGANGQRIAAYTIAQNGTIALEELAAYKSGRVLPHAIRLGDEYVFMPGESTGAGVFAGALFERLEQGQGGNTEGAVVVATKQALQRFAVTGLPGDLGSTGFAATDNNGQAVACAVTMNGPFGSGHTAQGSGVTLARAPQASAAGLAVAFLTPVLATDDGGHLLLAGAGAGGPIGTASMADALARLSKNEIVTRRNKPGAGEAGTYDTVNAILCQTGGCTALPDASAHGLGAAPPP
ncbi:MAG TPA: gamma-glutamyltransferase [Rhizomicrobium sp.]|nr:gamma-glutamyltransferase [Rhizomicrobium sp.]